jgi:hypothetical protein
MKYLLLDVKQQSSIQSINQTSLQIEVSLTHESLGEMAHTDNNKLSSETLRQMSGNLCTFWG